MYRCVGSYTSHVALPEAALARIPASLSFEEAASLPLVALTAWQALELAGLREGQRVLIHAGAGGVGSISIQLARIRGLHVITTCSATNADFVRQVCGAGQGRARWLCAGLWPSATWRPTCSWPLPASSALATAAAGRRRGDRLQAGAV